MPDLSKMMSGLTEEIACQIQGDYFWLTEEVKNSNNMIGLMNNMLSGKGTGMMKNMMGMMGNMLVEKYELIQNKRW